MSDFKLPELPSDEELGISDADRKALEEEGLKDDGPEMSAEEMAALFSEVPDAVKNTVAVAEQCNVEIELGKLHYPVFDPPETFTREGYLRDVLAKAMPKRYGIRAEAKGEEFIIHSIEDANLLPTYQPSDDSNPSDKDDPTVVAAIQDVIDRIQDVYSVVAIHVPVGFDGSSEDVMETLRNKTGFLACFHDIQTTSGLAVVPRDDIPEGCFLVTLSS